MPPVVGQRWSWRAALSAWVLAAVAITVSVNTFGSGWGDLSLLAHDGQRTTATVSELEPNNHNGCKYRFSIGGHSYTGSQERCADSLRVGDSVPVTYLPSNPSVSTTGTAGSRLRRALLITFLAPTALAVFAGFLGAGMSRPHRGQP